jgi:hypothetical protein
MILHEGRVAALPARRLSTAPTPSGSTQTVAAAEPLQERRTTAETLLRQFRGYGLVVRGVAVGRVVYATR